MPPRARACERNRRRDVRDGGHALQASTRAVLSAARAVARVSETRSARRDRVSLYCIISRGTYVSI
jgi:hypothetical protein